MTPAWALLAGLVLAQIAYPLAPGPGPARAGLVIGTVLLGWLLSVTHAARSRGWRTATALVLVSTGGGLAVEALGVATGFPFGGYGYGGALGPRLAGVPLIIPLAWTWMAWPAWLVAGRLVGHRVGRLVGHRVAARVALAAWGLAAWDLFLDPQMVGQGYWRWAHPRPALPGIPGVPVTNFLGWLAVAVVMMAALALALSLAAGAAGRAGPAGQPRAARPRGDGPPADRSRSDAPMIALYLWTYASSVLAGVAFLHLPGPAAWIGAAMGVPAVPLAVALARRRGPAAPGPAPRPVARRRRSQRRPGSAVPEPQPRQPARAGRRAGGAG